MRQPRPRGEEISGSRMADWVDEFGSYRHQVTEPKIDRWLKQFDSKDRDLAARLLDVVDFVARHST